ncbi:MAG: SDR family oxidoreductase [Alphaproteobacteria bacterium]|nr:SDR family oxidoreductase [Alphaproteobacteria bacterium]
MKVLVCGARGFIGQAIAARLEQDGHQVLRGVRQGGHAGEIDIDYMADPGTALWLEGVDALINAVGILTERGTKSFAQVHNAAPQALFAACRMHGVKHVIQISALGAQSCETPYFASKYAADEFLLGSMPLRATVLRPALVYGTNGTSARMFRMLASLPVHFLPAGGHQMLQPVHIDDLAELVARLLDPALPMGPPCLDVAGRTEVSYREMLGTYRRSMGLAPAFAVRIPVLIMRAAARIAGLVPGSPLTPDTWRMLQRGNTAEVAAFAAALGREPRDIETFVTQDEAAALRAEAHAAWQPQLLRITLALLWLVSALVSAGLYPQADSLARLGRLGLDGSAARVTLYGACALDFALGLATLFKPGRRLWLFQFTLILVYTALVAVALPEFLIDPFAPIVKNLPILAILIVLFNGERRP